jgi:hypothetical protein
MTTNTPRAHAPAHLLPNACYVCGKTEDKCHGATSPREPHRFWSNADADVDFGTRQSFEQADAARAAVENGASLRAEAGLSLGEE